ncbi:MAG: YkgJ family cysteine cluster protein [Kofleriaceae bacterium]|nr:YkgJ family cysteine cluster protein [Kofleriaceae bacterium]
MSGARTLGQFVEETELLAWLHATVADINQAAGDGATETSKALKLAVSCDTCTATKTCCWSLVVARLYEGIVVAAELVRTQRDTPELRAELLARAEAMEASSPYDWRTPCLFLDERERCTVYNARPTSCGALYVYSPPENCTARGAEIKAYVAQAELAAANALEEEFRKRLNLRLKVGRRYLGVLPRMVLVALEAWHRDDFRDYLRKLSWPTDADIARWSPASKPR